MSIVSKEILDQIDLKDKNLLTTQELIRKFGKEEDCVELHIYDLNGNLLDSVYNFEGYEIPDIDDVEGYYSEITFNPDKTLRDLSYDRGEYELRVNFHRRKIANTNENLFYIDTISPSRTELRVKLIDNENLSSLLFATNQFIAELNDSDEGANYFKDFALNLEKDIILTGVNIIAEPNKSNSFLIKLYEPLPNSYAEKSPFRIIEELTSPIKYKINLGTPKITVDSTELRGPNLRIDTRLNSSIPSAYKTYNDILLYTSSGSLNDVLNALSSSIPISVEYDNPNTDSGYVYDKFIHFSSAEERLRNFKYKLELIELYTSKSAYIDTLSPSYVSSIKLENESLKNNIIQNFDNYERYLYFDSGTYSWPKSNSTQPYTLSPTTSSEALGWFNSSVEDANNFDGQNPYILRNALPQYIIDNDQNEQFIAFVDMIGQYFDNIWLYIENITDKNIAHNSLTEGISKELVFEALKEKGIPAFDQFENTNLFEYLIGSYTGSDNFSYQAPEGQTMVSSSNGSIPKGDITKEVWKRLYHNAPYLLKTKGTERGMKALLACYGIPESILHIKEYGGPSVDKSTFRTFGYKKLTKGIYFNGIEKDENGVRLRIVTDPDIGDGKKYHEFTILPDKQATNNIIVGGNPSAGLPEGVSIISSSIYDQSGYFTGSFGSSSLLPLYSGRPITFFLEASSSTELIITASMYVDNEIISSSFISTQNHPVIEIGPVDHASSVDPFISSSFYVNNFKTYTSSLSQETKNIHTKDPNIIAGNNTSSYFNDLIFYNPLGSNLIIESQSTAVWPENGKITPTYSFKDYSTYGNTSRIFVSNTTPEAEVFSYGNFEYTHHLTTPDTVGVSMASEKTRYDMGTIDDNILSPVIRSEASALDRQPQDFSNLGIFFSPTFEINEDIIYTLGGFRLDDYIGDPTDLNNTEYSSLKSLRDEYAEKVERRFNFWDYIKLIQYFDHTIFKIIEEFAPAKANLKTGLVIEPHYLERNKFSYADTDFSNVEVPIFNIPETQPLVESEYILNEVTINVEEVLDGSGGSFENNFVHSRLSNKYFRISNNR